MQYIKKNRARVERNFFILNFIFFAVFLLAGAPRLVDAYNYFRGYKQMTEKDIQGIPTIKDCSKVDINDYDYDFFSYPLYKQNLRYFFKTDLKFIAPTGTAILNGSLWDLELNRTVEVQNSSFLIAETEEGSRKLLVRTKDFEPKNGIYTGFFRPLPLQLIPELKSDPKMQENGVDVNQYFFDTTIDPQRTVFLPVFFALSVTGLFIICLCVTISIHANPKKRPVYCHLLFISAHSKEKSGSIEKLTDKIEKEIEETKISELELKRMNKIVTENYELYKKYFDLKIYTRVRSYS